MNRRLYFTLPDVEISRKVEDDLLLARISEREMHFLAKRGVDLQDLPEASQAQKTDIVHGFQVGMYSGAIGGAIMGLVIYLLRDFIGMQLEVGIILILFLVGGIYKWFDSRTFCRQQHTKC
jgi:predicted lipid-binding transport protein (Tim44 family)